MTTTGAAVLVLALAAVAVIAYLIVSAGRGRRLREDIPPGMRPAYSDEQLERSVIERYMAWGLVLTLFFAVFLPVYGIAEARRIQGQREGMFVATVERGAVAYGQYCALCHAADLSGGSTASPYRAVDDGDATADEGEEAAGEDAAPAAPDQWPVPALNDIVARYEGSDVITDVEDLVRTTITRGRPGTPMPTWGSQFDGPLNDQEIEDIVRFILDNQIDEVAEATSASDLSGQELFIQNCAQCHGAELQGEVGPTLVGVFERHGRDTVLGIVRNGIYVGAAPMMPPWQNGYLYPEARYTDEALERIVDYLAEQQPATIPERLRGYQGPGMTLEERQPQADSTEPAQEAAAAGRRAAG
ncbi:MAG TPA: c-type cytochrome [Egibacteraceae bacterium]|nr:c-type cytochrome [Egibacteraceae bacterium]